MNAPPHIRSREAQLESLGNRKFDVLVIGAGISGVSAAHTLTSRGYRTAIVDSHDFASGTSQESSQLIWGGIKYMEQGHMGLVRGLCKSRNALIRRYPRRAIPTPFLFPHFDHDPHRMLTLMAGGYAYWALGGGFGGLPRYLSTRAIKELVPAIRPGKFKNGFEYTDARMTTSDARFTLDLLLDGVDAGLIAANHVSISAVTRGKEGADIEVSATDKIRGESFSIKARWIVNTAGIWVDEVNELLGVEAPHRLIFSKGIHLVIPKIETQGRALTFLATDGRIFFVVPWGEATLVGTTDTAFDAAPTRVRADKDDIEYLRAQCEAKFDLKLGDGDILNTKAGLRPLVKPAHLAEGDFLKLARSHKVWSDPTARVTSLWGGKFTNCFSMADEIADQVGVGPSGARTIIANWDREDDSDNSPLNSETAWDSVGAAAKREFAVTLEDLLRRRTNIALKIPNCGWGANNENEPQLRRLAESLSASAGITGAEILEAYRRATS